MSIQGTDYEVLIRTDIMHAIRITVPGAADTPIRIPVIGRDGSYHVHVVNATQCSAFMCARVPGLDAGVVNRLSSLTVDPR